MPRLIEVGAKIFMDSGDTMKGRIWDGEYKDPEYTSLYVGMGTYLACFSSQEEYDVFMEDVTSKVQGND